MRTPATTAAARAHPCKAQQRCNRYTGKQARLGASLLAAAARRKSKHRGEIRPTPQRCWMPKKIRRSHWLRPRWMHCEGCQPGGLRRSQPCCRSGRTSPGVTVPEITFGSRARPPGRPAAPVERERKRGGPRSQVPCHAQPAGRRGFRLARRQPPRRARQNTACSGVATDAAPCRARMARRGQRGR